MDARYDVVIIGAGLAGLTLARHLLLYTDRTVLLLDKRTDLPGQSQKVGESLVQVGGYYMGKVLDLEEHLVSEHYLKYNLRFHWTTEGLDNRSLEDYSQSSIRTLSNILAFQVDRNVLESELLRLNTANPRLRLIAGAQNLRVELSETGAHRVSFSGGNVACGWVVDASGRAGVLKRMLSLAQENPIRHGATWCWVDGLVDVERLTGRSRKQVLLDPRRRKLGHFPFFLATNHFCGEGKWFWVIPLHGKTSLGLVYDRAALPFEEVSNGRKMLDYVCREWPLFARDLPRRKILDEGRYFDFSYDARQTISAARWALTGESGRFSDPLYSPGCDLIAIYNTLIVDAIETGDQDALASKCALFESVMRVVYESYVPSYAVTYDCLGDQETFTLKYTWELSVYFGFFVLPFINDLFTDTEFLPFFLRKYGLLGPVNRNLQEFLSGFYRWKKQRATVPAAPRLIEFMDVRPLWESEKLFYAAAASREEAEQAIDAHLERLKEFARYVLAHVHAVVLEDRGVLENAPFIASLKLRNTAFDPESMRAAYAPFAGAREPYRWNLDPFALAAFLPERTIPQEVGV